MEKQRDLSLDVAKGICILLVVIGHTYFSHWFVVFISLFHMPVFFFISGMCLSERYLDAPVLGLRRKLRGYYWPFVKWNLVFILLHNLFVKAHMLDASIYGWRDIVARVIRAVTMTGAESLIGQFWFLVSLTWAAVVAILVLCVLKKQRFLTLRTMGGAILIMIVIASVEPFSPVWIPSQLGSQTFLAIAFFISGFVYKKQRWHTSETLAKYSPLLLLPALVWSFFTDRMDMGVAQSLSWLYYLEALCATLAFLQMARRIRTSWTVSLLSYLGGKTLYIFTFHILAFKLVTFAWIQWHDLPIETLSSTYALKGVNAWLWVVYTLVGVAVPLLIWKMLHLGKFPKPSIEKSSIHHTS